MSRLLNILNTFSEYTSYACIEGESFSYRYGDLLDAFQCWLGRLAPVTLPTGTVIGLRADYSLSSVAALLATLARGYIPALIPRDRPATEYLRHSGASALLEIDLDASYLYSPITRPEPTHPLVNELRTRGETGFVIFTSGSTGQPKATLHSLERFLQKFDPPGHRMRTLAFLLLDHIAGLDTLFYTLRNGGALVLTYRRDPTSILRLIAFQRVEVLPTSPSFLRLLCAVGETASLQLPSLKIITYGSEPMDPATLSRVNELFRDVRIIQKYGTTELGSPQTVSRSNSSLWLKFRADGPQVKVIDGILWLKTDGTMLGYLNAPTPDNLEGWYCTGDLVEVDGEWIRFLGRADELLKVGGERVSPSEVERVIRELDFVTEALVLGESHPVMGQVVAAQVAVSAERAPLSDLRATIRHHCRQRLGPHHAPVKVTFLPQDSFPALGYRLKTQRPHDERDSATDRPPVPR